MDNMLSVLESLMPPDPDDVGRQLAADFRRRRIERRLTRADMAARSGVALSNITRFEQKGYISLRNLILLAIALGYITEVRHIFSEPKFATMEELLAIHDSKNKKRAYHRRNSKSNENPED